MKTAVTKRTDTNKNPQTTGNGKTIFQEKTSKKLEGWVGGRSGNGEQQQEKWEIS